MLAKQLDVSVSVDKYGYLAVKFNLDQWEKFMAGDFTGDNAAKKGGSWDALKNKKPSDDIIRIEVKKYPKAAKAQYTRTEIEEKIQARVPITSDLGCWSPHLIKFEVRIVYRSIV